MRQFLTLALATFVALAFTAASASAHVHYILLPNGEKAYLANGGEDHVEGATWHPLHCVVHVGTPGTFAMDRPSNPVDLYKEGDFTGTCAAKPGNLP